MDEQQNQPQTYLDVGYSDYLTREIPVGTDSKRLTEIDADQNSPDQSGSKIRGGVIESNDGTTSFDLERGTMYIGNQIILGKLPDGTIGIIIKDKDGNELIHVSEAVNIFKSSKGNMKLDFIEQQLIVYDETGTPRVLVGKGNF